MGGGRRGGGRGAPGRRAPRQRPAPRWQLAGPWAVARSAPRPPPPRDEDEMRGGALASSSTDHGEGRTGAWRLEVWSSRGLGMGRPAVLGALGGGAVGLCGGRRMVVRWCWVWGTGWRRGSLEWRLGCVAWAGLGCLLLGLSYLVGWAASLQ